ncbi:MAG: lysophospholipid acyltransferase family protein [Muribaculaceae bacterium]|nr:lysophospholipid acyltransferase family protein [Muribaculaceae bacterium]
MNKFLFILLDALARLPLGILYLFSDFITPVLYHIVKYRRKVVRDNLISSFPNKNLTEIKKIERCYYRYLGDQIVETLKLLHISDKELIKRVKVTNYQSVNTALVAGKNAVLLMGHYNNWEWAQEITRYFVPEAFMASIYHPLDNKDWDEIFKKLRSRWQAHIVPMNKAPRVLLNKQNMPWVCGFIADAYTWHKNDNNWIEFLNHKTWFIYGPEEIGAKVGADYFYLEMNRIKRGYYNIIFHPIASAEEQGESYPHLRLFWKEFEATIQRNPAYWLWSHKRWK